MNTVTIEQLEEARDVALQCASMPEALRHCITEGWAGVQLGTCFTEGAPPDPNYVRRCPDASATITALDRYEDDLREILEHARDLRTRWLETVYRAPAVLNVIHVGRGRNGCCAQGNLELGVYSGKTWHWLVGRVVCDLPGLPFQKTIVLAGSMIKQLAGGRALFPDLAGMDDVEEPEGERRVAAFAALAAAAEELPRFDVDLVRQSIQEEHAWACAEVGDGLHDETCSQSARLIGQPPRSDPMSKSELARRIKGRHSARPRDIGNDDAEWEKLYGLVKCECANGKRAEYTIRLDGMDPATRKRVEHGLAKK